MRWFQKKRDETGIASQLRDSSRHPFSVLDGYVPLQNGNLQIYRAIREAVPLIDAAIWKIIRLVGEVTVQCEDKKAQHGLSQFLLDVDTGRGQRGLQSFLDCYLNSMLVCGRGIGEVVLSPNGKEVVALLCGDVGDLEILAGKSPLEDKLCIRRDNGVVEELPYPELILFTPFQPEVGNPYGVSLLRPMPFLTEILMKIYQSIGMNWERMGNVRFAVVSKHGDEGDRGYAQERCQQMAREWSAAMQAGKQGHVRDFVAVGDVDIKVIGADNQILDSEVPVRQILEQLVAKTGIPPFMLGLSWSSTERMSEQQADLMTSELTAMRYTLNPIIERICGLWLRVHGYNPRVKVEWATISLQDEVEQAKAALYLAQASQLSVENGV